jgi:hypothetical protein
MSTVVIIITIMKKLIFFNFRMGMKKREAGERRGVFSVKKKKKKNPTGKGFVSARTLPGITDFKNPSFVLFLFFEFSHV